MPLRKKNKVKQHILHTVRELAGVVYKTAGVFILLLTASHIISLIGIEKKSNLSREKLLNAVNQDMENLLAQGEEMASDPELFTNMQGTEEDLFLFLQQLKDETEISNITITDAAGFVRSRTSDASRFGDNIFLTSAVGRALYERGTIGSIERRRAVDELSMIIGRDIFVHEEHVGSLFVSKFFDKDKMSSLRDDLFSAETEMAVYTSTAGVYASTFTDPEKDAIVRSYFHKESSWVVSGMSDKTLRFEDGKFYDMVNITFSGLEEDPGGIFIFIPRTDLSFARNIAIMLITFGVFAILLRKAHIGIPREIRGLPYSILLFLSATPIVLFGWSLFLVQEMGYTTFERISYPIYNSTLSIEPGWGIFDVGSSQRASIVVISGDEAINAIQVKVSYNPALVSIDELDMTQSPCSYVIDASIHAQEGYIAISCVLLGGVQPSEDRLMLADVQFTPLAPGNISFLFDDQVTQVLAHDGLGTNVLRSTTDASYNVDVFNFSQNAQTHERSFMVFSPSHPNQAQWYSVENAQFTWLGKPGDTYRYTFDQDPNTIPEYGEILTEKSIEIPILLDGVYYFHMQSVQSGQVAHYRVQVDTTKPKIVTAKMSDERPHVGDVVRFSFLALDALSGVQHNYYLDLGNGLLLPVGENVYIPFLEKGEKKITLHVFDEAGNIAEQKFTLFVQE